MDWQEIFSSVDKIHKTATEDRMIILSKGNTDEGYKIGLKYQISKTTTKEDIHAAL